MNPIENLSAISFGPFKVKVNPVDFVVFGVALLTISRVMDASSAVSFCEKSLTCYYSFIQTIIEPEDTITMQRSYAPFRRFISFVLKNIDMFD